ncbi:Protein of unknown function [Thermomonospora echinospora]|uniref:DUF2637 domain-containing protein n=1 Tax=Thermomonospora echinospora TaxID=1992 RepID=A0A1H6DKS2_9ACTN|nr:DUF2637 domain-containing protein [Thermomonospora echinospora]SEG85739.1 Protein of unknown function [Thermomonospora echinospora]
MAPDHSNAVPSPDDTGAPPAVQPDAHPGRTQHRVLTALAGLGVAALAAGTFVLTYEDLRTLALAGGAARRWAPVYPVLVDVLIVVTVLALVATRHARWWSRWPRWALLLVVVAGAAAASVQRAVKGYEALPDDPLKVGVAVAPYVILVIVTWLWLAMFRQFRRSSPRRAAPAPAPEPVDDPEPEAPAPPPLAVPAPRSDDTWLFGDTDDETREDSRVPDVSPDEPEPVSYQTAAHPPEPLPYQATAHPHPPEPARPVTPLFDSPEPPRPIAPVFDSPEPPQPIAPVFDSPEPFPGEAPPLESIPRKAPPMEPVSRKAPPLEPLPNEAPPLEPLPGEAPDLEPLPSEARDLESPEPLHDVAQDWDPAAPYSDDPAPQTSEPSRDVDIDDDPTPPIEFPSLLPTDVELVRGGARPAVKPAATTRPDIVMPTEQELANGHPVPEPDPAEDDDAPVVDRAEDPDGGGEDPVPSSDDLVTGAEDDPAEPSPPSGSLRSSPIPPKD